MTIIFISKYPVAKDGINYLVEVSEMNYILEDKYNVCIYIPNNKNIFFKRTKYKRVYSKYWSNCEISNLKANDDFLIKLVESAFESYYVEVQKEKQKENEKKQIKNQKLVFENWDGIIL